MISKICLTCSNSFKVGEYRKNTAKYCSRPCYVSSQRKHKLIIHHCRHCNKSFSDSPSVKRVYCSKECNSKCQKEDFKPKFTTVRRSLVRRNLINKCERCGYDEFKEILGVHHKDKNRNNNSLDNLMILCPNCHSILHHKHISH